MHGSGNGDSRRHSAQDPIRDALQGLQVVRLDANGALLTKFNDRLELQCHELTATNTTLERKDRQLHTNHRQSLFCTGLYRRILLYNIENMHGILKKEGM